MGRLRLAARLVFSGRPHRIANLGHQRNAAGYPGLRMSYQTGSIRQSLFRRNSNATGGQVLDDYEVDMTANAKWEVENYMRGECANAGQESLVATAIDEMDIILIIYQDFNPEHTSQPDEGPIAHIQIPTSHPEAIGEIIAGAIDVFYEYAESVNKQ